MNANAKKWVAALRSGEYSQGRGRLRKGDTFCCLGVACDLYAKEHPEAEWLGTPIAPMFRVAPGDYTEDMFMPQAVKDWLEFEAGSSRLAGDNDAGRPFTSIAATIEYMYDYQS